MDASFDVYNGGGWSNEVQSPSGKFDAQPGGFKDLNRVILPVTVRDLIDVPPGQDKYVVGTHSFNTVHVIGRIHSAVRDVNDNRIDYELKDPSPKDDSFDSFKIIRYRGTEMTPTDEPLEIYDVGKVIHAVGKLKSFAGAFSLVAFHIREVTNPLDTEIFDLEATTAKLFYQKDMLQRTPPELELTGVPMLLGAAPMRLNTGPGGGFGGGSSLDGRGSNFNNLPSHQGPKENATPPRGGNYNAPQGGNYNAQQQPGGGLSMQQSQILKYVRTYGTDRAGVTMEDIKTGIHADANLARDLAHMTANSLLYNTTDENTYAAV